MRRCSPIFLVMVIQFTINVFCCQLFFYFERNLVSKPLTDATDSSRKIKSPSTNIPQIQLYVIISHPQAINFKKYIAFQKAGYLQDVHSFAKNCSWLKSLYQRLMIITNYFQIGHRNISTLNNATKTHKFEWPWPENPASTACDIRNHWTTDSTLGLISSVYHNLPTGKKFKKCMSTKTVLDTKLRLVVRF